MVCAAEPPADIGSGAASGTEGRLAGGAAAGKGAACVEVPIGGRTACGTGEGWSGVVGDWDGAGALGRSTSLA